MPVTRNRPRTANAQHGFTGRIPPRLWRIVSIAWEYGLAVSSNIAREHSSEVALAASLGWISTVSLDGKRHHRIWNVTAEGVMAWNNRGLLK